MGKTTNILDLNNRLTKVEKENVAQNSYTSLKNKPKINNVTLTGNKSLADIGAAAAVDLGVITDLTTTDKSSAVAAINEVKSGLTVKSTTISNEHFTTVRVSEVGGVKCLYIATTGSDTALDTTADYVKYFTLPVGFRPADTYTNRFLSKQSASTADTDWVIRINTNGDVSLVNYSGEAHPGFANTFVFI